MRRRKHHWKICGLERGVLEDFARGSSDVLTGGWKLFKKEAWQENSGKNRRGGVNLKETMSQLYIVYQAFALGIIPFCLQLICEGLTHNFESWDYLRTGTSFKDILKDYFC